MLERATSCLRSGTRDSLRGTQYICWSTRALRPGFWDHGAEDLELPRWATLRPRTTSDKQARGRADLDAVFKVEAAAVDTRTCQDAFFLDFLYPPQVLAWLYRSRSYRWDNREVRIAKGAPTAIATNFRGYASTPRQGAGESESKKSRKKSNGGTDWREPISTTDRMDGIGESCEASSSRSRAGDLGEKDDAHLLLEAVSEQMKNTKNQPTPGKLRSIAQRERHLRRVLVRAASKRKAEDRSNKTLQPTFVRPRDSLLHLLSLPKPPEQAGKKAWAFYNALDENDRIDVRLKSELLVYMSNLQTRASDAHCISLYWSLPLDARSLFIYEAALGAFLRHGDYEFAAALHREALFNIKNAHPISVLLFQHVATHGLWHLALEVMGQHVKAASESSREQFAKIFWIGMYKIPGLLQKAAALIRFGMNLQRKGEDASAFRPLTVGLANEALAQYLQIEYPNSPRSHTTKDVVLLLHHIKNFGQAASNEIENFLAAILEHPSTQFNHAPTRELISRIYLLYRNSTNAGPPESMLMNLLEKTAAFAANSESVTEPKDRITLDKIITDWEIFHGKLSAQATLRLVSHFAFVGIPQEAQKYFDYFVANYPGSESQKDIWHSMIYVHARRADVSAARKAFDDMSNLANEDGHELDIRSWNSLLYAYSCVDDLERALSTLENLLSRGAPKPTDATFQPVLEMLANRGDLAGISQLMRIYDMLSGQFRPLGFLGSLMRALIANDKLAKAKRQLERVISLAPNNGDRDSLTPLFNILITAYALRRDLSSALQTYQWMKEERVRADPLTYAAVIQALALKRRTSMAWRILRTAMPRSDVHAAAFHYAIVMTGFHREGQYEKALQVHEDMRRANVKESASSSKAYLKAKMMFEQQMKQLQTADVKPSALEDSLNALQEAFEKFDIGEALPKEPNFGNLLDGSQDLQSSLLSAAILIHGRRRCFDAVQDLHALFLKSSRAENGVAKPPSIGLLSALMTSHLNADEHTEVEKCWRMAQEQAAVAAQVHTVPDIELQSAPAAVQTPDQSSVAATLAEIGFNAVSTPADSAENKQVSTEDKEMSPLAESVESDVKLAVTRRHILSIPLRCYISSLAAQSRHQDAISTVAHVLSQGYLLDNTTWNEFIMTLCTASPPLVLTAFTFTERFLIPQFPGWTLRERQSSGERKKAALQGLQYIQARHLQRNELMPQYKTFVHLATALLQLRRKEATEGPARMQDISESLDQHVGDMRSIRKRAPKTMYAVQSMPKVDESLQNQLLRLEWSEL